MAAGKINLQANDGKVAGVVFEDGASSNVTVTVPKEGGVVATKAYADTKVSKTGNETIAGVKTFSGSVVINGQASFDGGNGTCPNISAGLAIDAIDGSNTNVYNYLDASSIDLWAGTTQKTGIHINGQTAPNGGSYVGIRTGGSECMRIDTAGNVGIGVIPSASTLPTIQSQCNMLAGQDESNINTNAYYSGGVFKYIANGYATSYMQLKSFGSYTWKVAPSGIAGNPITWTNAMTLGANGNLLVGATTDNGIDKLQVNGSISSGGIVHISNGDLNNYKTRTQMLGTYPNEYVSNIPIDDHGYLEVIVYSPDVWVMQRFTTLGVVAVAGRVFVRCLVNGVWSAWVEK